MKNNIITLQQVCLIFLFIIFAGLSNFVIAQNNSISPDKVTKKAVIDNGYYKYEITGNTKTDAENESKAKEDFVTNHPEQYEQMKVATQQNTKQAIDYKEYLTMPVNKKTNIDEHPEKYYFINK